MLKLLWIAVLLGGSRVSGRGRTQSIQFVSLKVDSNTDPLVGSIEGNTPLYFTMSQPTTEFASYTSLGVKFQSTVTGSSYIVDRDFELVGDYVVSLTTPPLSELSAPSDETIFRLGIIGGIKSYLCTSSEDWCIYTYELGSTGQMVYLTPVAYAGQTISLWLIPYHTLTGAPYFSQIDIGEGPCDLTPYFERGDSLTTTGISRLRCDLQSESNINARTIFQLSSGDANIPDSLVVPGDSDAEVGSVITILPVIHSISPGSGSSGGGMELVILGDGFSPENYGDNEIWVQGEACVVSEFTRTKLKCILPAQTAGSPPLTKMIGLERLVYYSTNVGGISGDEYVDRSLVLSTNFYSTGRTSTTEVIRGFYTPPATGNFWLRVSSQMRCVVYFGDTAEDKEEVIDFGWSAVHQDDFYTQAEQKSGVLALTEGQPYYIEIQHRIYDSHAFLGIEREYGEKHQQNLRQIQKLQVDFNGGFETHDFEVGNPTAQLSDAYYWSLMLNTKTGETRENMTISYKIQMRATALEFKNKIRGAFAGFWIGVEMLLYDAEDNLCTECEVKTTELSRIVYRVRIYNEHWENPGSPGLPFPFVCSDIPPQLVLSDESTLDPVKFTHSSDYTYDAPLHGTFGLKVVHPEHGEMEIGPFDICENEVDIVRKIDTDFPLLQGHFRVWRYDALWCRYTSNIYFRMDGFESPPLMEWGVLGEVTGGGSAGYTHGVSLLQPFSHNLFQPFLTYTQLHTLAQTNLVDVRVKGLPSACKHFNCTFDYVEYAGITDIVQETIIDLSHIEVNMTGSMLGNDLRIKNIEIGDTNCAVDELTRTATHLSCHMELSSLGMGGEHRPQVFIDAGLLPLLTEKRVSLPIALSGVDITDWDKEGGQTIAISGSGLPTYTEGAARSFALYFGETTDYEGVILSSVTTQIQVITPTLTDGLTCLYLADPVLSVNVSFCVGTVTTTPNKPTILSLTPNYVNPLLLQDLTISFTLPDGFDPSTLTQENTKVYMEEDPQSILPIRVLNTGTLSLTVVFPGYKEGKFHLGIKTEGIPGYWYEKQELNVGSVINSITPSVGSYVGGGRVIIGGEGFYDDFTRGTLRVYVGGVRCVIQTATHNSLECITGRVFPGTLSALPAYDSIKELVLLTKFKLQSVCNDTSLTCVYTHSRDYTPLLYSTKIELVEGEYKIVAKGLNFQIADDVGKIHLSLDGLEQSVDSYTDTQIIASITHVPYARTALATLSIDPYGHSIILADPSPSRRMLQDSPINFVSIPFELTAITPSVGSKHGTSIHLTGVGFSQNTGSEQFSFEQGGKQLCREIEYISFYEVICHSMQEEFPKNTVQAVFDHFVPIFCGTCEYETSTIYEGLVITLELTQPSTAKLRGNIEVTPSALCTSMEGRLNTLNTKVLTPGGMEIWDIGNFRIGDYELEVVCINGGDVHTLGYSSVVEVRDLLITYHSGQYFSPTLEHLTGLDTTYGGGVNFIMEGPGIGLFHYSLEEEGGSETKPLLTAKMCHHADIHFSRVDDDTITFLTPKLLTTFSYGLGMRDPQRLLGTPIGYGGNSLSYAYAFDDNQQTAFTSTTDNCWVGVEDVNVVILRSARVSIPSLSEWTSSICGESYIERVQKIWLESSEDGITYSIVNEVESTLIHKGWTNFPIGDTEIQGKYFRARFEKECNVGELEIIGEDILDNGFTDTHCDILLSYTSRADPTHDTTLNLVNASIYLGMFTPMVDYISTSFLVATIGSIITLKGEGFPNDVNEIEIYLNGIACIPVYAANNFTECRCEIQSIGGLGTQEEENIYFADRLHGAGVVLSGVEITLAYSWSSTSTWGGLPVPVEGDSVYVPRGKTLLYDFEVDTSDAPQPYLLYPRLNLLVVEGKFIVKDGSSEHKYLGIERMVVKGGEFWVGSEDAPYNSEFTLYMKSKKEDKRIPIFGTNSVGVYEGDIHLHGKYTPKTWFSLAESAVQGASSVYLDLGEALTWGEGDWVVLTPTEHWEETESLQIDHILEGNQLVFTTPLLFHHKVYEREGISFAGEVGLLTHNIVLRGDFQTTQSQSLFGGVLKVYGDQSNVQISGVEFYNMGQNYEYGQYAVSVVNLDCPSCYLKGSSMHHCMNRGITLDNVYRFTVENNVLAYILGDGFGLDNLLYVGEVQNTIKDNLVTDVRLTFGFTDKGIVTGSGFFLPSPTNNIIQNVVAGTEGHGFNFHTPNLYENHLWPVSSFTDNYAHSLNGIGLNIMYMLPRELPVTGSSSKLKNMFEKHNMRERGELRGSLTLFRSFRSEQGIYIHTVGAMDLTGSIIADARDTGIYIAQGDYIEQVKILNTTLVRGAEEGRGLGTPMMANAVYDDIRFCGYDTQYAIVGCRGCSSAHAGYYYGSFSNITWVNSPKRMVWNKPDLWKDIDGSFAGQMGATITQYAPHIYTDAYCGILNISYSEAMYCNLEIHTFFIDNLKYSGGNPWGSAFSIRRQAPGGILPTNVTEFTTVGEEHSNYTKATSGTPKEWNSGSMFKIPIITGEEYWFGWAPSEILKYRIFPWWGWSSGEVLLHTTYSEERESFHFSNREKTGCNSFGGENILDPSITRGELWGRPMGSYFHNNLKMQYTFVFSKSLDLPNMSYLSLDSSLPPPAAEPMVEIECTIRLWSDYKTWDSEVVPLPGENVLIAPGWNVMLDVSVDVGVLVIKGRLFFDPYNETHPIILTARQINIYGGELLIGSEAEPFANKAFIHLASSSTDPEGVGGDYPGALNVHGKLAFYGAENILNRRGELLNAVETGETTVEVVAGLDWAAGDKLLLAPTEYSSGETALILDISNGMVTVAPLLHPHAQGGCVVNVGRYNVYVSGNSQGEVGGRIVVSDKLSVTTTYIAYFVLHNIHLSYMGARGTAPAITIQNFNKQEILGDMVFGLEGVVVDGPVFGPGVEAVQGKHLGVNMCVIYTPRVSGVSIKSIVNASISNNIVISTQNSASSPPLDSSAAFIICPRALSNSCEDLEFSNNSVYGSETGGIISMGFPCDAESPSITNNNIFSCKSVCWLLTPTHECTVLSDLECRYSTKYTLLVSEGDVVFKRVVVEKNKRVVDYIGGDSIRVDRAQMDGVLLGGYGAQDVPIGGEGRGGFVLGGNLVTSSTGNLVDVSLMLHNLTLSDYNSHVLPSSAIYVGTRSINFYTPYTEIDTLRIMDTVDIDSFIYFDTELPYLLCIKSILQIPDAWGMGSGVIDLRVINNIPNVSPTFDNCSFYSQWNAYECKNIWLGILVLNTSESVLESTLEGTEDPHYSGSSSSRTQTLTLKDGSNITRVSDLVYLVQATPGLNQYTLSFIDPEAPVSVPPILNLTLLGQPSGAGIKLRVNYVDSYSMLIYNLLDLVDNQYYSPSQGANAPILWECGHNSHNVEANSLDLYLTGGDACNIVIQLIDSIKISLRIKTTLEAFDSSGGELNFIDSLALLLDINSYRIRVVGVLEGSVIVTSFINSNSNTIGDKEGRKELITLSNELKDKLQNNLSASVFGGEIISFEISKQFVGGEEMEEEGLIILIGESESTKDSTLKVVIIVCLALLLIMIAVVIFCYIRHKKKKPPDEVEELKLEGESGKELQECKECSEVSISSGEHYTEIYGGVPTRMGSVTNTPHRTPRRVTSTSNILGKNKPMHQALANLHRRKSARADFTMTTLRTSELSGESPINYPVRKRTSLFAPRIYPIYPETPTNYPRMGGETPSNFHQQPTFPNTPTNLIMIHPLKEESPNNESMHISSMDNSPNSPNPPGDMSDSSGYKFPRIKVPEPGSPMHGRVPKRAESTTNCIHIQPMRTESPISPQRRKPMRAESTTNILHILPQRNQGLNNYFRQPVSEEETPSSQYILQQEISPSNNYIRQAGGEESPRHYFRRQITLDPSQDKYKEYEEEERKEEFDRNQNFERMCSNDALFMDKKKREKNDKFGIHVKKVHY